MPPSIWEEAVLEASLLLRWIGIVSLRILAEGHAHIQSSVSIECTAAIFIVTITYKKSIDIILKEKCGNMAQPLIPHLTSW